MAVCCFMAGPFNSTFVMQQVKGDFEGLFAIAPRLRLKRIQASIIEIQTRSASLEGQRWTDGWMDDL